jgi:hypothetical protein
MVLRDRLEQRPDANDAVLGLVRQPERRPDDQRLVLELEPRLAAAVDGPPGFPVQRLQALADVVADDVATLGDARLLPPLRPCVPRGKILRRNHVKRIGRQLTGRPE